MLLMVPKKGCIPSNGGKALSLHHNLPSLSSLSTFASLMPLMASNSFLGAWAKASTVLIPPSISFLISAAAIPSSCITKGFTRRLHHENGDFRAAAL